MRKPQTRYDIIGDIHGYAGPLRELLGLLGYRESAGIYRHTDRQAIFLGDFIDRGPGIRDTLQTVRAMLDGGAALAVMGNHEYNAICFHTCDGKGDYLRAHTAANVNQHAATLAQYWYHREEWEDYLRWFKTLPLFLDLPGLRVVHACWDNRSIEALDRSNHLTDERLVESSVRSSPQFHAIETLLKGKELSLPAGVTFQDNGGYRREKMRIKWWAGCKGQTYRSLCFPENAALPSDAINESERDTLAMAYGEHEPAVFFGHYWLPPSRPRPLAPNIACLDYSIAKDGLLVAYRWDGECKLDREKFVMVRSPTHTNSSAHRKPDP